MFDRVHHQRIEALLKCFDDRALLQHQCLLSGGTAAVLGLGEYRKTTHVEFCCGSAEAYRAIRQRVDARDSSPLFRAPMHMIRGANVDRHGIRLAIDMAGSILPIEIIQECRIPLRASPPENHIAGVRTMCKEDLVATKLMANADRYADDSFQCQDIIDLAMIATQGGLLPAGVAKARTVYKSRIDLAFNRARAMLLDTDGLLTRCMGALQIDMPAHRLRSRIEFMDLAESARWP